MPDPTEPGWRPEYTGDTSLGNVGSGTEEFAADLDALYRAGRNELPAVAAVYSGLTSQIHGITGWMAAQFDRPGRGMELAHRRLLVLREEAHEVLRATCLRLEDVGVALVLISAAYAATDQEAADEFAKLLDEDAEDFETPPPGVPPPPPPSYLPPGTHGRTPGGRV